MRAQCYKGRVLLAVGVLLSLQISLPAQRASAQVTSQQAAQIEGAAPSEAPAAPKQPRRVLVFLTPPHLMPQDPHRDYCIPQGAHAFEMLGKKTGAYAAVVSDDLSHFLPDRITLFDAVVLLNTSRNWITPTEEQVRVAPFREHGESVEAVEVVLRKSLLAFVRNGGGLMGVHYAIGANRHWPEFAELMGATYDGHPWNEEVGIKLDEPDHPLTAAFEGRDFRVAEEIFQFKDPYAREKVRVLLSLDTAKTNMGVQWIRREDKDFALAWVRPEGEGRVFYTALGHHTELYWNPTMLKFYLGAVQFCAGDLDAPTAPLGAATQAAYKDLFNGKNLDGWRGDPAVWSVEDGVITGQTTSPTQLAVNNFLVWEGGRPADFELRLEFKLVGGNSGIYFHAEPQPEGEPLIGPQADFSADHRWTGVLMEWKKREVLAERGEQVEIDQNGVRHVVGSLGDPKALLENVRDQDWNEYTLITQGERTVLKINGVTMCEVVDSDPRRTPNGYLALQVHKGPPMKVQFRNIRMREIQSQD